MTDREEADELQRLFDQATETLRAEIRRETEEACAKFRESVARDITDLRRTIVELQAMLFLAERAGDMPGSGAA